MPLITNYAVFVLLASSDDSVALIGTAVPLSTKAFPGTSAVYG